MCCPHIKARRVQSSYTCGHVRRVLQGPPASAPPRGSLAAGAAGTPLGVLSMAGGNATALLQPSSPSGVPGSGGQQAQRHGRCRNGQENKEKKGIPGSSCDFPLFFCSHAPVAQHPPGWGSGRSHHEPGRAEQDAWEGPGRGPERPHRCARGGPAGLEAPPPPDPPDGRTARSGQPRRPPEEQPLFYLFLCELRTVF